MLAAKDPGGVLVTLQPHLGLKRVSRWTTIAGGSAIQADGLDAPTVNGQALAGITPATTNMFTLGRRIRAPTAVTAGATGGFRSNALQWHRGTAAGLGGFHFIGRIGVANPASNAGTRIFFGFINIAVAIGNVALSSLTANHLFGIGFESGAANFSVFKNDGAGAPTVIDLTATYPANTNNVDFYELAMFCAPFGTTIHWSVRRMNVPGQALASGSETTKLPGANILMAPQLWVNNGAVAAAAEAHFFGLSIESDY